VFAIYATISLHKLPGKFISHRSTFYIELQYKKQVQIPQVLEIPEVMQAFLTVTFKGCPCKCSI